MVANLTEETVGTGIWVDYAKGNDKADGTAANPLQTIAAAVRKVATRPIAARTIYLAATAAHVINETILLKAEHSNLTITTAPGASSLTRA